MMEVVVQPRKLYVVAAIIGGPSEKWEQMARRPQKPLGGTWAIAGSNPGLQGDARPGLGLGGIGAVHAGTPYAIIGY